MTQPSRLCCICLHPVTHPVPITLDGVEFVAHQRCKEGWDEEVKNSQKENQ